MDCNEAQILMTLYLINDPSLTNEERIAVEDHLQSCPVCAEEYRENLGLVSLLRRYATLSGDSHEPVEKSLSASSQLPITAEESWAKPECQFPEQAKLEAQPKPRSSFFRLPQVAALVASIILVFMVSWQVLSSFRSSSVEVNTVHQLVDANPKVELVAAEQRKPLPFGQPIITQNQKQEIQLGRMHRLVMNVDTVVTIRSDQSNGRTRYNLELVQGELYVEVIPGNPFTVKTPNANLIITGTKFNVRYDQNRTDLALLQGSIHFGNRHDQWTDVTAGHSSSVLADAAPTIPQRTEVRSKTAWTCEVADDNKVEKVHPVSEGRELLASISKTAFILSFPPLETIDYKKWTNDHHNYFAREFPWIFKIEEALNKVGIKTDYVTLLMISGDIHQFHYSQPFNQPIPVFEHENLKRIVDFYRIDPALFTEIIPQAKADPQIYQQALAIWHLDISQAAQESQISTDLALFTYRATNYLNNTYTAAYLWIQKNPKMAARLLADREYRSKYFTHVSPNKISSPELWMEGLKNRISAIQAANMITQELLALPSESTCSSPHQVLLQRLEEKISEAVLKDFSAR